MRKMLAAIVALMVLPTSAVARTVQVEERSIDDLQRMMAGGQATSADLVRAYLARIAAMDRKGPALRAIIALNPDALAQAKALDAERKAGHVRGPLHGVPILIKDNIETLDPVATTAGSLALKDNVTRRDAGGRRPAAGGGGGDPGQDQSQRMGQYPLQPVDERLERDRRAGAQSLCARPHRLRIVERIGCGGGGELRGGGGGDGDRRIGGMPVVAERAGRAETLDRARQPRACRTHQPQPRTRRGRWAEASATSQ